MRALQWLAACAAAMASGAGAMEGHESPVSIDEVCVLLACRPATHVHLEGGAGQAPLDAEFQKTPYVFHGVVSVLPGESLFLEGEVRDDDIANLRYVKDVADPRHTLTVGFRQVVDQDRPRMLLSIANPFDRPVLYRAVVMLPGARVPVDRDTCPVQPRTQRSESWPEPVVQVFLIDLRFATESEARACDQPSNNNR